MQHQPQMILPQRQRWMLWSLEGILLPWFDSERFSRRGCAFIESATWYCISAGGNTLGGNDSRDDVHRQTDKQADRHLLQLEVVSSASSFTSFWYAASQSESHQSELLLGNVQSMKWCHSVPLVFWSTAHWQLYHVNAGEVLPCSPPGVNLENMQFWKILVICFLVTKSNNRNQKVPPQFP